MSASSLMSIGARAMTANYAALQTIGNNIANASTVGYSRQSVELETVAGQSTPSGYIGRGVDVATVSRAHDRLLDREAALSGSIAAADQARSSRLDQLERVFAVGEEGLGHATGQLLNAFGEVAARPQDLAARQVVLGRADDLAARFRAADAQIGELQAGVGADLGATLAGVNDLARQLASVNRQIVASRGGDHSPNDLLDQRDRLVGRIGQQIGVSGIAAEDGSMNLFIGGGQRLVLGGEATTLVTVADEFDASRLRVGVLEGGAARSLPDASLVGGAVAGLLRFQGEDLVEARNAVGRMAQALGAAVNRQQAEGLDLRSPAGAGAPMFALGAPRALPAAANARDAAGAPAARIDLEIRDASALQASDYRLRSDAASGRFELTRLSDGLVRSVAAGDTVDGFRINTGGAAPQPGDTFLLQPVGQGAADMRRVLGDPRGLAAASPLAATLDPANRGGARVSSLQLAGSGFDAGLRAEVEFTSADGDYAWTLRDGADAPVASGSGRWSAAQPIAINGWQLGLDGAPAAGDRLRVERNPRPAGDNGNALAMLALRDQPQVGRQGGPDGTSSGGQTFGAAYADALAAIGVRVQGARTTLQISQGIAQHAEGRRSAHAGVNLDEEAARLVQFQQSYQAAAKVLQVAQATFDALLQATSR